MAQGQRLIAVCLGGMVASLLIHLPQMESDAPDYHSAASGLLSEIDRMQVEVREYLSTHPVELET